MSKNRYFISFAEEQVAELFNFLHVEVLRYKYYCFKCSYIGSLSVEKNKQGKILRIVHPSMCAKCCQSFQTKFVYCEPDFLIRVGNKCGIVSVEGPDHERTYVAEKDAKQRELLRKKGIKVFVVEVRLMEFKKELLDYLCDCYLAVQNDDLYLEMCKRPNYGLMNYATFESYMDKKMLDVGEN